MPIICANWSRTVMAGAKRRILVLGAQGQIGDELCRCLAPLGELISATHRSAMFCSVWRTHAQITSTPRATVAACRRSTEMAPLSGRKAD
jgi:dTDP-4-dehydrorhamnose reductase